jgi:hypothetical protein
MKQVLGLTIFIHGDYLFDLITQKKKTEKHIIKCVCVCVCIQVLEFLFLDMCKRGVRKNLSRSTG